MPFKKNRVCEICNKEYIATSTTSRWCKNCIPNKKAVAEWEKATGDKKLPKYAPKKKSK